MAQQTGCNCGKEVSNEISEWIYCFIIVYLLRKIGEFLYKPFEESNMFFKFLGILSIIILIFLSAFIGLTHLKSDPLPWSLLVLPGGLYGFLAVLSLVCKGNE